jgi:uncharacterized heparinase superfamily protein
VPYDPFLVRARRALGKPPRYVAWRAYESAKRRLRRPWSRVAPHLFGDRALLLLAGARDIDALWTRLRAAPFFIDVERRAEWVDAFQRRYPGGSADYIAAAERAIRHEHDLLGSGPMTFAGALPWHTDFKTGRTWPLEYSPTLEYTELDQPTDVKVPWELSRCQHFTALGQAYWFTDDERYAREFVAEVDDWITRNPWARGVNWACAMDVALRAVSWIWGFRFFADSAACADRGFRSRFLRSLFLHGEYIATHLEKGPVNGNHYLCDGVGLVFLGVLFHGARRAQTWLDVGRSIVVEEVERQTYEDGVDFEQSTAYHRLVLEAFITAHQLLRLAGETIPPAPWARLERMHEYVAAYTKPDGLAPLIGDADDGRIQKLGMQRLNDHRYLLSTGAVLFNRGDWKAAATQFWSESFWLLGPRGAALFDALPEDGSPLPSRAFPHAGVFVLRSHTAHLIVDCGEIGMHGLGGHGHNDILGFELWMNGANLITDCGAYLYTASREWRNRFRSTAFHNVVQVDDEESNRFIHPDALWTMHYDARPTAVRWQSGGEVDVFEGGHTGYQRLPGEVTVWRRLELQHSTSRVVIIDRVMGSGEHRLTWRFHTDPSVQVRSADRDMLLAAGGQARARLTIDAASAPLTMQVADGWVSPSYGERRPTKVIVASVQATLPVEVTWRIDAVDAAGG